MKQKTLLATGLPLFIFGALGALCYLFVNYPQESQRFSIAVSLSASLLHTYAFVLYVRGFRYFKQELRIAYTLLSVGIAFLGIAISQLPVINAFGLFFWIDSGLFLIPYIIAVIPMLLGLGRFARNIGLHTRWLSLPIVGVMSLALAGAATFLPHIPSLASETELDAGVALTVVISTFFVASARGALLIRRKAGASYAHSLNWLVIALSSAAVGALIYMLELLLAGAQGWYYEWSMTILFFNVTGWLFMRAGYAFSIIGLPVTSVQKRQKNATSIDIILHVESLASNPAAINSITDELRVLTARAGANSTTTAAGQSTLLGIYRELENYLVTNEPLRKLSREEIRQSVERTLGINESSTTTFWPQVKSQP